MEASNKVKHLYDKLQLSKNIKVKYFLKNQIDNKQIQDEYIYVCIREIYK